MSTLKVGTIQDTNGNNPSTAEQIGQGRAKAWVNFDGTDEIGDNLLQIKDSFNVTSVTDSATGDYFVTFTNQMSDRNYAVVLAQNHQSSNTRQVGLAGNVDHTDGDYTPSGFRVTIETPDSSFGNGRSNTNRVCAAVFGA